MRAYTKAILLRGSTAALVALASSPLTALAEEEEGGGGTVLDYLNDGGSVMWVILALSLVGTVLFVERALDLYVLRRLSAESFMAEVLSQVESRRFRRALDLCNVRSKHPLVDVVKAGVVRANRREKEMERAMEREMLRALPELQKRVALLGLLANTATLTGLLGTIFGLITAFNSVAAANAAERQEALAAGISQAMYTTAFGIAVAVPMLFFHHFISKRQERILVEVEGGATALLVAMTGKPEGASDSHGQAPAGSLEPARA